MRVFQFSLAVFIAVAVARIQDALPLVAAFRPGKLIFVPLLAATLFAVPRWQLVCALRTTSAKCVGAIAFLALLSIPLSIWFANSLTYFLTVLMPGMVLFVVASAGFADRRTARVCIVTLVVSASATAMYLFTGAAPTVQGRAYIGGAMDPNDSAALFVATLPFAMLLASERKWTRLLGIAAVVLLVAGVAKTGSRGGATGLLAVGLILIIVAVLRRRWMNLFGIIACAAVFGLAVNDALAERFQTLLAPQLDYNVTDREGRVEVWKRGVGYMLTHPVVGVGLVGFETAEGTLSGKTDEGEGIRFTAAHNAFVQIGAELGVIGLLAFVTAFWTAGRGCWRAARVASRHRSQDPDRAKQEMNLADATLCALVAIATTGFFLSIAYLPITLFGLAAGSGVTGGTPFAWRDAAADGRRLQ